MSNNPGSKSKLEQNALTFFACIGLILLFCGLIGLMAMVLPQFLFLIPVLFGFSFLFALHYLTWGRWLSQNNKPIDDSKQSD